MDPLILGAIVLAVGSAIGFVIGHLRGKQAIQRALNAAEQRAALAEAQVQAEAAAATTARAEAQTREGETKAAVQREGEAMVRAARSAAEADSAIKAEARVRTDLDKQTELAEQTIRDRNDLRLRLEKAEEQLSAAREAFAYAQQTARETFQSLAGEALKATSGEFLKLAEAKFKTLHTEASGDVQAKAKAVETMIQPIRDLLDKQTAALGEMEQKREGAYAGLKESADQLMVAQRHVFTEARALRESLRNSQTRGQWGELALKNAVELAGMTEHCDFTQQTTVSDGESKQRPDMLVHLPGDGLLVLDSKAPMKSYLEAQDKPAEERKPLLMAHALALRSHVNTLAQKAYWDQFDRTPDMVILFVPLESALSAALDADPGLHADAMQKKVLLVSPVLLVALLRAAAYGWNERKTADNARLIADTSAELVKRLQVLLGHFEDIGKGLSNASKAYNSAVNSYQSRLLPQAAKVRELAASTAKELPALEAVQVLPVEAPKKNEGVLELDAPEAGSGASAGN